MKIDSHQHFWVYNPAEYGWISEEMKVLKQDYLPQNLNTELKTFGFDGSVAVQARQSVAETEWLLHLAEQYGFIKGVVGWVDLCSSRAEEQLAQFASHPRLVGVRHVIHDESDDNFMLRNDFQKGLGLLKNYGLAYDILVFPRHLRNTVQLVSKFPGQAFVLDHIAKPAIKDRSLLRWKEEIEALAQQENVYCKLSGMVTEADWRNWKPEDFFPYLDIVFKAFGIDRLMIGSDWPVCRLAGEYSQVMGIVCDYIKTFSLQEKNLILGATAEKVYRLKP